MLALAEAEAFVEVQGHAADQHAGVAPGLHQHLCQERGGGGLAVRASDDHRMPGLEKELLQRFGKAHLRHAPPPRRLGLDVVGAENVADHRQVHVLRLHVVRGVRREHADLPLRELVAHGRVDVLVGAGDLVSGLAQEAREGAHPGASDAEQVDAHAAAERISFAASHLAFRAGSACLSGRRAHARSRRRRAGCGRRGRRERRRRRGR